MKRIFALIFLSVICFSNFAWAASSPKIEIELVQYKPEAFRTFDALAEKFNKTHDNIHLTISSPNEPITILKTRFIRENYPDIIGIGGDVNYSNFQDAELLSDLANYKGLENIKKAYINIIEGLEFVPTQGTFGVPYMANAAGILYNKDIFDAHGWKIPESWNDFIKLCEDIKAAGILPMYFGFKDTWTTLAPWNALAVDLAPADVCQQVNMGKTTF